MRLFRRLASDALARKVNRLYYAEVDRMVRIHEGFDQELSVDDVWRMHQGAFRHATWEMTPRRHQGTGWSPLGAAAVGIELALLRGFAAGKGFTLEAVVKRGHEKDSYARAIHEAAAGDDTALKEWYREHPNTEP